MENKDLSIETEICKNCKREVPQSNYLMHVAHCSRNIAVCPICGEAVPKGHLKEHKQEQHSMVECPDCRFKVQAAVLANHRATSCGKRITPCSYCELEVLRCDLEEHESYCGARTERCEDCGELVMLKYRQLHLDSNHGFLKLHDEPGPTPSWQSPSRSNRTPLNDMSSLTASLLPTRSNEINVASQQPAVNKTDYKRPTLGEDSSPAMSPRDTPRTLITPYDASEDLRAKVKLARHDLNEIKNSFIMNEERRDAGVSTVLPRTLLDYKPPPARPRDKFVTNLVPYEKHESYKINAKNLGESSPTGLYNYLGAKEPVNEATNLVSLSSPAPKVDLPDLKFKPKNHKVLNTSPTEINGRNNLDLSSRNTFHDDHGASTADKVTGKPAFSEASSKMPRPQKNTGALPKKTASCNGTVPKRHDSNKPTRRRAPPPPIEAPKAPEACASVLNELHADEDEVRLPCEFCEKMVPASRLVLHETGCRPDLAQIHSRVEAPRVYNAPSPDVQLPCEFCEQLVPASELLKHQALCDV